MQVLPLHAGARGIGLPPLTFSIHPVLPLLGPPKLSVTDCPAMIVVAEALKVTGTMANVVCTGSDILEPELATAVNVVVFCSPVVL